MSINPTHKLPKEILKRYGFSKMTGYMMPIIRNGLKNRLVRDKEQTLDTIYLETTKECNLKCIGCFSEEIDGKSQGSILDNNQKLFQFLLDIPNVVMLGGEPFHKSARKSLKEFIKQYTHRLTIVTNGTLIDEEVADMLKDRYNISILISIDGNEELHDNRRGKNVFNTIQKNVKLLNDRKILWGVSTTMTAQNIDYVTSEEYIRLCQKLGSFFTLYIPYCPTSCQQNDQYQLDFKQYTTAVNRIQELNQNTDYASIHIIENETNYGKCRAGSRGLYIAANGNVNPCPIISYSPFTIDDLLEFEGFIYSNEFLIELQNLKEKSGGKCIALYQNQALEKCIADHKKNINKSGGLGNKPLIKDFGKRGNH
jgi:Predicted Fe-S oxidoreductases